MSEKTFEAVSVMIFGKKGSKRKMKNWTIISGLMLAVIFSGCDKMMEEVTPAAESEWPWEKVSPESQGIQSGDLDRMVEYIESENVAVHSIIIYKNGTIPYETYFDPFNESMLHNLKSTSKGVISALTGIALSEGYLESLDETVLSYLSEYEVDDTAKSAITIRDLLTMTAGLEWNENNLNSMYTFFVNKRIVKRVLDQPLETDPGETFNYNTGLTHLLSAVITEASGMSTLEFAEKYLFEPLDIQDVHWDTDREGYHIGGSELFLAPRDMMKFGVMYLQDGTYQGQQIVPEDWVIASKTTQVEGSFQGADIQYGYLWWLDIGNELFTYIEDEERFLALGARGQRIFISPEQDAVVVITADERNESHCDILIRDYILPVL